jgi:hypothetical protein
VLLVPWESQAQIGLASSRHFDREYTMLEREPDRVFDARRERRGDLGENRFFAPGWEQNGKINVAGETRRSPPLDSEASDNRVGDVTRGEK